MKRAMAFFLCTVMFILVSGLGSFSAIAGPANKNTMNTTIQYDSSSTNSLSPTDPVETFLDEGDYYLVRGEKKYLRRDANRMVVKLKENVFSDLISFTDGSEAQNNALQSVLNVSTSEMEMSIDRNLMKNRISVVNVILKNDEKLLRSRIQSFNDNPSVEYAYPLYYSKMGMNMLIPTDEILVRFSLEYEEEEILEFCHGNGLSLIRETKGRLHVYLLRLTDPTTRSVVDVANALSEMDGVLWAEPNFLSQVNFFTTDPLYDDQWHLHNTGQGGGTIDADVDAPEAWATLGSGGIPDITIAIIDSGVDLDHEDLNIWANPGETGDGKETNGIDDDGNGYVDDYRGWDFYSDDNDPNPGGSHGTACAGVAAAKGDNAIGVAGIAHGCRILAIKMSETDSNFASYENIGSAIEYAADMADVISCSWSTSESSYIMDAVDYAISDGRQGLGCPVFFATGNGAARGWLTRTFSGFPSGYQRFAWALLKSSDSKTGTGEAWVDNVTLQDGSFEDFNSLSPPALPTGWGASADAPWTTVGPPDPVYGGTGNSVKTGTISPGEDSLLYVAKTYSVGGDYSYRFWFEGEAGDTFCDGYWNGSYWQLYAIVVGGISFPANYENTIAVGASNNLNLQSYYSQYGDEIDFVAPSNGGTLGITTTDRTGADGYSTTNYTSSFGGTSSATPLAAGVAALMLSDNPSLTAEEIRVLMRNSCDKIGTDAYDTSGWNRYYGFGKVNANTAIINARSSLVQLELSSVTVAENSERVVIVVRRMGSDAGSVSVDYATVDGTATAGADYGDTAGTLIFDDGDKTPQAITIPIYTDGEWEGDETFTFTLSNPSGGAVLGAPDEAVITIINNQEYYLNDGETQNDNWCTAVGDDANDGLTPSTPKASAQSILATYDLAPGDIVHMDTGIYLLTSNIEITAADEGSSASPVIFEASPYGVTVDRNSTASGSYAWYLNHCDHVTLRTAASTQYPLVPQRPMKITGGYYGVRIYYGHYFRLQELEVCENYYDGIYAYYSDHGIYVNNLVHANLDDGITSYYSDDGIMINNTVFKNSDDQLYLYGSGNLALTNNIIWADGSSDYGIYNPSSFDGSDYNLIHVTNGAYVGYFGGTQTTLSDWQTATGGDANSLSVDPQFVDETAGDYHLASLSASYHDGAWLADATHSPAIDSGDPADSYGAEPELHGYRINMGAFGGTFQASQSLDSDGDGLSDTEEDSNGNGIQDEDETDPFEADSDDDGLEDGEEKDYWGDDWNADIDGDGLINILDKDSDGDGFSDGLEVERGSDPSDPADVPRVGLHWIPLLLLSDQ